MNEQLGRRTDEIRLMGERAGQIAAGNEECRSRLTELRERLAAYSSSVLIPRNGRQQDAQRCARCGFALEAGESAAGCHRCAPGEWEQSQVDWEVAQEVWAEAQEAGETARQEREAAEETWSAARAAADQAELVWSRARACSIAAAAELQQREVEWEQAQTAWQEAQDARAERTCRDAAAVEG